MVVVLVLSQNKVLQRFAEQILDHKVVNRAQQRFEEQDPKCPASLSCSLALVWWRRSPTWTSCSRSRTETWKLFLRAPLLADTRPLSATVHGGSWNNFQLFSHVMVFSGRFAVALENLDFQRAPCTRQSLAPDASVGGFGRISHIFLVKVNSDPVNEGFWTNLTFSL